MTWISPKGEGKVVKKIETSCPDDQEQVTQLTCARRNKEKVMHTHDYVKNGGEMTSEWNDSVRMWIRMKKDIAMAHLIREREEEKIKKIYHSLDESVKVSEILFIQKVQLIVNKV